MILKNSHQSSGLPIVTLYETIINIIINVYLVILEKALPLIIQICNVTHAVTTALCSSNLAVYYRACYALKPLDSDGQW